MQTLSFNDLLRAAAAGQQRKEQPKVTTLPEARIAQLREILARDAISYDRGDLVTPTKDSGVSILHIGEPHLVLGCYRPVNGATGSREPAIVMYEIAAIDGDGDITTASVHAWQIEKYVGAGS